MEADPPKLTGKLGPMNPRLEFALDAAYRAGQSTLGLFHSGFSLEIKEDDTPVTNADKGAEAMIRRDIAAKYPGEAILGEEEGASGTGDARWVIDPIDGTKSFVAGVPLYACLLSYEEDGEPTVAACYLPAVDEMYWATKGEGAFVNGRRIHVSDRPSLKGSTLLCGGHKTLIERGRLEGFLSLIPETRVTRTWGDAFGHMLVASGRADAMIDPRVNRWDISSPSLIVKEAGGTWTDFAGTPHLVDEAISSNGKFHSVLTSAFPRR